MLIQDFGIIDLILQLRENKVWAWSEFSPKVTYEPEVEMVPALWNSVWSSVHESISCPKTYSVQPSKPHSFCPGCKGKKSNRASANSCFPPFEMWLLSASSFMKGSYSKWKEQKSWSGCCWNMTIQKQLGIHPPFFVKIMNSTCGEHTHSDG